MIEAHVCLREIKPDKISGGVLRWRLSESIALLMNVKLVRVRDIVRREALLAIPTGGPHIFRKRRSCKYFRDSTGSGDG